jgi:hypothetical protein
MCGERQWRNPGVYQSVVPAALLACTMPLVVPVALRLVCTWGSVGSRLTLFDYASQQYQRTTRE